MFSDELPPAIAGIALYVISVDRRRLDPHFLVAWLHSRVTRDWLKTHSQRTVQPNLTLSLLAGMKIPVPTLELQAKAIAQARDAGVELFDSLCEALGIPTNKDSPDHDTDQSHT